MAEIVAISISDKKGERKNNISNGLLLKNSGLENDAHAGFEHRQVSLLAIESIAKMLEKGLTVKPGNFAENLTTKGIDLVNLPIGTRLQVGREAILRVTQIGKECHNHCEIYYQAGDCIMPREGIFCEVLLDGKVKIGDPLEIKHPYRFGIITASDKGSCGEREDLSGPVIREILMPWGDVAETVIVPDEKDQLIAAMRKMVGRGFDAVFTTGGTGMSPRDITPEATLEVVDRLVPGIAEAIRRETAAATPKAMLSRAVTGISASTLIINLPGSPKAVTECLTVLSPVLDHALETISGRGGECARH